VLLTEEYGVISRCSRGATGECVGHGLATEAAKARYVRGMFNAIAPRYDLANTLLSAGWHRAWKRHAVRLVDAPARGRALDLCCGTGDLALLLARQVGSGGTVVGVDFSEAMLRVGRRRAVAAGLHRICHFTEGDAETLPLAGGVFDVATIGFGIRNVGRPAAALGELRRVLRPGGRLAILEFGRPVNAALRLVYDAYSFAVVPRVGRTLTGHRDAYLYLPTSIRHWADQDQFDDALRGTGFVEVRHVNLLAGIATIHLATRPR